jgi:predicted branched-subunit amino acid permease
VFFVARHFRHPAFAQGVRDHASVVLGVAAWALMTGVAMVQSGLVAWQAVLMTLLVYAGSAQLAAVPLLLGGAPVWVILATAFCVNLRFVVFSIHMRPYLMHLPPWQRLVTGYLTGDITYVLFARRYPQPSNDPAMRLEQQAYLAGHSGLNYVTWMLMSLVGVALAHAIPLRWGLGYAGILALLGVLCSLATSRLRVLSAAVSGGAAVLAFALPFKLNIVVAIVAAVSVCLFTQSLREQSEQSHG